MYLSPREGDSIEQSMCRQRTEEEDKAVKMFEAAKGLVSSGANEIRLDPANKPVDLD